MRLLKSQQVSKRSRLAAMRLFTIFSALLVLGWWLLSTFVAERTAPTAFLLYLPPQPLILFPVVGALSAIFRKRIKVFAAQTAILLFCVFVLCGFQLPNPSSTHKGPSIRVVSWNVLRAGAGGRAERIAQALKQFNADIICLQETRGPNTNNFRMALRRHFPDWHFAFAGDVTTLSRFPLKRQQKHAAPKPSGRLVLDTTFQMNDVQLRVFNTHWSTIALTSQHKKQLPGGSAPMRSLQAKQLLQLTRNASPFLVAGDFNNPPRGKVYARLSQQWNDAFALSGLGFGGTYPARLPLLRIDYIWTSPGFRVLDCYTWQSSLSDHRAVVTDVVL